MRQKTGVAKDDAATKLAKDVAEYVMGWGRWEWCEVGHSGYGPGWNWTYLVPPCRPCLGEWNPGNDPSDDYRVLLHVRQTWGDGKLLAFTLSLHAMLAERDESENGLVGLQLLVHHYQVGDFSRAALAALEGKE